MGWIWERLHWPGNGGPQSSDQLERTNNMRGRFSIRKIRHCQLTLGATLFYRKGLLRLQSSAWKTSGGICTVFTRLTHLSGGLFFQTLSRRRVLIRGGAVLLWRVVIILRVRWAWQFIPMTYTTLNGFGYELYFDGRGMSENSTGASSATSKYGLAKETSLVPYTVSRDRIGMSGQCGKQRNLKIRISPAVGLLRGVRVYWFISPLNGGIISGDGFNWGGLIEWIRQTPIKQLKPRMTVKDLVTALCMPFGDVLLIALTVLYGIQQAISTGNFTYEDLTCGFSKL